MKNKLIYGFQVFFHFYGPFTDQRQGYEPKHLVEDQLENCPFIPSQLGDKTYQKPKNQDQGTQNSGPSQVPPTDGIKSTQEYKKSRKHPYTSEPITLKGTFPSIVHGKPFKEIFPKIFEKGCPRHIVDSYKQQKAPHGHRKAWCNAILVAHKKFISSVV
jgi:hypothetical protein